MEKAQTAAGLDPEYCLVATVGGQLMLTPPSDAFLKRVTWDEQDVPVGWRPDSNSESPVRIEPDTRFGRPSIKGVSTEAIWEQDDAGVDIEEMTEEYDLDIADVRWALAYEYAQRAA